MSTKARDRLRGAWELGARHRLRLMDGSAIAGLVTEVVDGYVRIEVQRPTASSLGPPVKSTLVNQAAILSFVVCPDEDLPPMPEAPDRAKARPIGRAVWRAAWCYVVDVRTREVTLQVDHPDGTRTFLTVPIVLDDDWIE